MPIGLFGKYLSINNARGKSHVEQTRYARLQKYPSHAPPYPASLRADSRNAGRAPVFCFELARARWCPCCASSFRAAGVMTGLHARSRASLPFPRRNRVRRTNWEFSDRPVNCVCASITIYRSRSMPPSTDTHVYVRGHRRLAPRLRRPFRNRPDSGPPLPPPPPLTLPIDPFAGARDFPGGFSDRSFRAIARVQRSVRIFRFFEGLATSREERLRPTATPRWSCRRVISLWILVRAIVRRRDCASRDYFGRRFLARFIRTRCEVAKCDECDDLKATFGIPRFRLMGNPPLNVSTLVHRKKISFSTGITSIRLYSIWVSKEINVGEQTCAGNGD